ncbi:universal stress protein [Trinickia sp. YCB016]
MYKRIFVAIDDSKPSRRAFDTALDLAKSNRATLRAFHALKDSAIGYQVPSYDPSVLREKLTEEGAVLAQEFSQAIREAGVDGEVVTGPASTIEDVAVRVLQAATAFDADVLVMGTHGRRGVHRLIMGSVAERCLRQSALPVLLIPSAAPPRSVE